MLDEAELQRALTTLALQALEGRGFALAGSGAIREHGIVDRLTHDVDLFTSASDPSAFVEAVGLVVEVLTLAGHKAHVVRQADTFTQLLITAPDGRSIDMDLAVDWREHGVVSMPIGDVLSPEDAVSNKISALYSRGEVRDFIDVDAIRVDGRF